MSDSINRRTILQTLAVGLALVPQSGAAGIPDEVVPNKRRLD